jgi:alpha-galactosidase
MRTFGDSLRRASLIGVSVVVWLGMAPARAAAAGTIVLQRGDSFISAEGADTFWTIGNASLAYTVGFDESGRLTARDLTHVVSAQSWNVARQADTLFKLDGRELTLNRSEVGGFTLTRVETAESATGIELRLVFTSPRDGVQATRVYAIYPGAPVIETWMVFEATTSRAIALSQLNTLQLVADGSGLTWVRGLEAPEEAGGSFAIERRTLGSSDQHTLEALGRSTQFALPLFAMRSSQGVFFGGYLWSGSWRIDLLGQSRQRFQATLGLGDTETSISTSHPVELPHAIFGVAPGDESTVAPALARFIVTGLRGGRPLAPLVTYNGWFIGGTRIDADTIERQIDAAAEAGAELFELDAGWYEGAGEQDAFDFSSGLGSWRVDRRKFPDGLRPLSDRTHALGMKFGLWVEPERVDLRLLGQPGMAQEAWLAQENGFYQGGVPNDQARTALLDFGVPDARAWILDRLTALVLEHGVDYLKWDSNYWINNTRPQPGRGARDGNFEHVRGLYLVLAELKARFPDLLIENCAGGGNRLDLGLMRYTDAGWMDDRTSPASHVRHNFQGLSTFLPPAYLLSYLLPHADEPMHDAPDMALYARSRMPGVFGLSFAPGELDEGDVNAIRDATDLWKAFRDLGRTASAQLLTSQVNGPASPAWDALALIAPDRDQGVIYAFQNDEGVEQTRIVLRGLDPAATYTVRPLGSTAQRVATGATLMTTGVDIEASSSTASEILQLGVTAPESAPTQDAR